MARAAGAGAYRKAQEAGQAALRTAVLDAASGLLGSEGAAALSMRRVAGSVGASTKVLYTMFGSKEGLVEALCEEGFARFEGALRAAVRSADPRTRLVELGHAYRDYALSEPHYYQVMFGARAVSGRRTDPGTHRSHITFDFPVRAVRAAMEAGVLKPGDPQQVAETLWAALHGLVSLELAGHLDPDNGARRLEAMLSALSGDLLA
ncbi:TetR/AcrR family transcriptional regulator [Phaeacidiphilus oryzae]|uniref:TetR/AcrR family transcriptional regulator n=1 Tax=Phaeacidiphilus oryzae TaxID=348818 RepID=UPI00055BDF2D|nr:TetR/AcrR family transcriptional regulator [Phaeacidiphilus oryzae]